MRLFGFEISREKKKGATRPPLIVTTNNEGSVTTTVNTQTGFSTGGLQIYNYDINGQILTAEQMINQYRLTACYPDVDTAIEHIVNDAVIVEQGIPPVSLNMDGIDRKYDSVKDSIQEHFQKILNLLQFNSKCHDIFKRWYIDGRIYFYVNIDRKNPKRGILSLDYIEPSKIRKVIDYKKTRDTERNIDVITGIDEYYVFNDNGLKDDTGQNIRISTESVINVQSGLVDPFTKETMSYLFKAIKPANQLKMMEDSAVIYRITRAPERRVFYIDVGNLPTAKADQYVDEIMGKFRNKVVYDPNNGEIKNNRQYLSVMEDFFLPRREGGKATEIQTLPGASNIGEIADLTYFQNKLYQSLNVPRNRLLPDNINSLGGVNEVTREEISFSKFIQRLRNKFNSLFYEALRIELLLTRVLSESDWEIIKNLIYFEYQHDNYFEELKRIEIENQKLTQLQQADGYKGIYFSKKYIVNSILGINDEEWDKLKEEMHEEKVEEAKENFEIENISSNGGADSGSEESDSEDDADMNDDTSSGEDETDDKDYQDFVNGNTDTISQTGDTTDTIDTEAEPNQGEEPFTRPAEPNLKAGS